MYIKLDEEQKNKIERITMTDYDFKNNMLPSENVTSIFEDLLSEIEHLEEKIKDIQQDIEENYELKSTNIYSEYGINERDFY